MKSFLIIFVSTLIGSTTWANQDPNGCLGFALQAARSESNSDIALLKEIQLIPRIVAVSAIGTPVAIPDSEEASFEVTTGYASQATYISGGFDIETIYLLTTLKSPKGCILKYTPRLLADKTLGTVTIFEKPQVSRLTK